MEWPADAHPLEVLSWLAGIAAAAGAITAPGRRFLLRLWRAARGEQSVPTRTVALVADARHSWWHMGGMNGEPAMQIVAKAFATNLIDRPVRIVRAELDRPARESIVHVQETGGYIPPHATTDASFHFWIAPPVRTAGAEFRATVTAIDQFGNRHKVKFRLPYN